MRQPPNPEGIPLDRPAHYLRASRKTGSPRCSVALAVLTERGEAHSSTGEIPVRLAGWRAVSWGAQGRGAGSGQSGMGHDAPSFWRWLLPLQAKQPSLWVWQLGAAHGLTVLGWWDQVAKGLWTIPGTEHASDSDDSGSVGARPSGVCVVSDPPTIILARRSGVPGSVRYLDCRNLGLDSWEDIPARPGDCESLRNWLQEWYACCTELSLGGVRGTAASQAWHGWRHHYLSEPLLVHGDNNAIQIERAANHPGRCEVSRLGRVEGGLYHVDASAHYPGCASQHWLPVRLSRVVPGGDVSVNRAVRAGYCAIARCKVETAYPLAPVRYDGLTIWPVGRYRTALCWPEVDLLRRYGASIEVEAAALYEPGRPFNAFFAALWEARRAAESEGNKGRAGVIKRLMNGLIGRCAAWDWGWHSHPTVNTWGPYALWGGVDPRQSPELLRELYRRMAKGDDAARRAIRWCRWRAIGWHTQYERCDGEAADSMPALTAWVASLARVSLWEWIEQAGRSEVYYYDTDSVWTTERGYRRIGAPGMGTPAAMGGLRLLRVYQWCELRGQKYYTVEGRTVCAGVSAHLSTPAGTGWRHWSPERVSAAILRNEPPRAGLIPADMPEHRQYRHGRVAPDGTVTPIELPEV